MSCTGKAYYAHAGNWVRLGNYDEITSVGTGKHLLAQLLIQMIVQVLVLLLQ